MSKEFTCYTASIIERPKRKLLYLPSQNATEYFSFCEEKGCDWETILNKITEKFDTAALLELPEFLTKPGFSKIAAGIEVPMNYEKEIPEGFLMAELDACTMLYMQSEPYEKDEDYGIAIGGVYAALENYQPAVYGYQFADEKAPKFNFGADAKIGARLAVPVTRMRQAFMNIGNGENMEVSLIRADAADAEEMWKMQTIAFREMLDYYQDYDTSPGNESLKVICEKIRNSYFYFICMDGRKVGGIRIKIYEDGKKAIAPLFVMEEYRNKGIAQKAILLCEEIHGRDGWELDTILEEAGNCHLYEKMGYHATGHTEKVNDKLTLTFYVK